MRDEIFKNLPKKLSLGQAALVGSLVGSDLMGLPGMIVGTLAFPAVAAMKGNLKETADKSTVIRKIRDKVKTFYPKILKVNVVEIQKQSEEFLSTESWVVDNSKSKNLVKRTFSVSNESSQTYITSLTATTTTKNELTNSVGLGFDWGGVKVSGSAEVKSAIDKSLQKEYSISETKKITRKEEITVEVQPQTRTKIFVHWKLIWQHGIVKVLDSWKREIEIPFKICSKITFDQEVVDE